MREALDLWRANDASSQQSGPETLLRASFYSAVSIYLSGNFDYELQHWESLGLSVPVLPREDIIRHFEAIVRSARAALESSNLSPVLFLFPLRVAGARAKSAQQRATVADLLVKVKRQFVVADAFLSELQEVWGQSPPHESTEACLPCA